MFKRIALFLATNLAVLLVLSVVLRLLGVDRILDESGTGINYEALLILSLVIGFGGSFISLAMSKWMAKRSTGARRNASLVAVSTGLLHSMPKDEVEAVLAHEVAHVANGDMVTLALVQGVVNTFIIFLSRVIGHVVDRAVFRTERGYGPGYFIVSLKAFGITGGKRSLAHWFMSYPPIPERIAALQSMP